MKKLFLSALVVISAFGYATAQDYSKSILVFGSGNFSSTYEYSAAAGVGYQFNKNWTAGGTFSYANRSGAAPSLYTSYSLGGFLRYTEQFGSEHRFFWYLQGNAGYFSATNDYSVSGAGTLDRRQGIGASIAPGVGINLPRGFALTVTPASISFMVETSGTFGRFGGRSSNFDASIGRSTFGAIPVLGINKTFRLGRKHHAATPPAEAEAPSAK